MARVSEPQRKSRMLRAAEVTKSSSFSCESDGGDAAEVLVGRFDVEGAFDENSDVENEGWRLSCLRSSNFTSPE